MQYIKNLSVQLCFPIISSRDQSLWFCLCHYFSSRLAIFGGGFPCRYTVLGVPYPLSIAVSIMCLRKQTGGWPFRSSVPWLPALGSSDLSGAPTADRSLYLQSSYRNTRSFGLEYFLVPCVPSLSEEVVFSVMVASLTDNASLCSIQFSIEGVRYGVKIRLAHLIRPDFRTIKRG